MTKTPTGNERRVRANPENNSKAQALLDHFTRLWHGRISRLDDLFAEDS